MKKFIYASLVATAMFSASMAAASNPTITQVIPNPTVGENNGQLSTHIKADDKSDGNVNTVYGSTGLAASDVLFTGDSALTITGGGFALIDSAVADGFTSLIINPDPGFSQLDFSIQLLQAGSFDLYYSVAGDATFTQFATISQAGSALFDYLIDGNGLVFDAIKIVSTTAGNIDFEKQNSVTLSSTGAVPEPGTWGLMLLGFGGMGFALRRSRRRQGQAMMQVA